jgi:hypothetical protein
MARMLTESPAKGSIGGRSVSWDNEITPTELRRSSQVAPTKVANPTTKTNRGVKILVVRGLKPARNLENIDAFEGVFEVSVKFNS